MKAKFYVIDPEGNISYNAKKEAAEAFSSRAAAQARADEIASYEPGKPVIVAQGIEAITYPVGRITKTPLK